MGHYQHGGFGLGERSPVAPKIFRLPAHASTHVRYGRSSSAD
jgi:hypothetical protein